MNRTIKEATVQRYHYDSHQQLSHHLDDFVRAYNFGRRLKTLKGLTPYEFICKSWSSQPERFTFNPLQQMPGLNTYQQTNDPLKPTNRFLYRVNNVLRRLRATAGGNRLS
jgi:hypothetical protein